VEQGVTVFVVSWKSADASMADLVWDDYIAAQIEAIEHGARAAGRESGPHHRLLRGRHHAGRDAGALARRGQADKVKSATFFTAQVDFSHSGELKVFIDDQQLAALEKLSGETGLSSTGAICRRPSTCCAGTIWSGTMSSTITCSAGLPGVRPAPLERRCHQSAGQVAHELSEGPLPR
jgi:hypothetical protein